MINSIGSSSSYYNSLFATNGTNGSGSTTGSSSLSQTEAQLFASIDSNGDGSLAQFETNAGALASGLEGTSASGRASAASLLSQLQQSAQSLVAGSAAGITENQKSSATSNTDGSSGTGRHHNHGHSGGANSLTSQFVQQYQAAGGTSAATSTLAATA